MSMILETTLIALFLKFILTEKEACPCNFQVPMAD